LRRPKGDAVRISTIKQKVKAGPVPPRRNNTGSSGRKSTAKVARRRPGSSTRCRQRPLLKLIPRPPLSDDGIPWGVAAPGEPDANEELENYVPPSFLILADTLFHPDPDLKRIGQSIVIRVLAEMDERITAVEVELARRSRADLRASLRTIINADHKEVPIKQRMTRRVETRAQLTTHEGDKNDD
jgi:hypothetical protein